MPITELNKNVDHFLEKLRFSKKFLNIFEKVAIDKYREKESELSELTETANVGVAGLEAKKRSLISSITQTESEVVRKELEREYEELHLEIEKLKVQRNSLEVKESDIHNFVRHAKEVMEHPTKILANPANLPYQKELFDLIFEAIPNYQEILNGTPKMSWIFNLDKGLVDDKSLCVN